MKTYYVEDETGNREVFYSLHAAKAWMKEHPGSRGSITKIYSSGEWVPCGEITLKGSNATRVVGAKDTDIGYN